MTARVSAWIGGALFVVALGVCAASYLFVFGRSHQPADRRAIAVDVGLFTIFALHHSLFARDSAKRLFGSIPPQQVRSLYVYAASALLIVACVAWRPIGGELYQASATGAAGLIVVQLAGIGIIARAVARIDPLELAGIRSPSPDAALQTSGVYRWVRHPIYLGWTLAVFGTPHMTGDRFTFAVVSTLYLALAVPFEERSLARSFGDEYRRYTRTVKWRMLPFIY